MKRARGREELGSGPAYAVAALTVAAGVAIPRLPAAVRPVANLVAAATGVVVARRAGLSWRGLGLDRAEAGGGMRAGLVAAAPILVAVGTSVKVPVLRPLFGDTRVTGSSPREARYETLVRIPLGTALSEELLFRGALFATVDAAWGTPAAIVVSSVVFGIWHVLPAIDAHASNPATAQLTASAGGRVAHVGATVLTTALAGVAFAFLRVRFRSVATPIVVHTVLNGSAYLAARSLHPENR